MADELQGAAELAARIRARAQFASKTAIPRALRAGGRVLRDAQRELAPVLDKKTAESTSLDPGALRDGIRLYSREVDGEPQVVVGPNAKTSHVAAFVELGHRNVKGGSSKITATGTKGKGRQLTGASSETPAHPFLRPAYEGSIAEVQETIVASMKESLERGTDGR